MSEMLPYAYEMAMADGPLPVGDAGGAALMLSALATDILMVLGLLSAMPPPSREGGSAEQQSSGQENVDDANTRPASAPVGRAGTPLESPRPRNSSTAINGRDYTGHAQDQMQDRGIPPSAVEDAIENGTASAGNTPDTTRYRSAENNVTVVVDSATGRVITVYGGRGSR